MNKYLLNKQSCKFLIQLILASKEKRDTADIMDAQEALKQQMIVLAQTRDWSNEVGLSVKTRDGFQGVIKRVNENEPKITIIDDKSKQEVLFWSNEISVNLPPYIFSTTKRV